MKSASSGLDVIAEEDNDDENGAQVVPSIVTGGGGNAEVEDESEVMSQDDDCFGSQGSLGGLGVKGGSGGAHSEEDDEDAMDIEAAAVGLCGFGGNLGGSRNRLVYVYIRLHSIADPILPSLDAVLLKDFCSNKINLPLPLQPLWQHEAVDHRGEPELIRGLHRRQQDRLAHRGPRRRQRLDARLALQLH